MTDEKINDGGPAFLCSIGPSSDAGFVCSHEVVGGEGMSLRDWFAGRALTGYASNPDVMSRAVNDWCENGGPRPTCVADWLAGLAYEVADSMLAARNAEPHP